MDYPQLIDKKRDVVFAKSLLRDALLKTRLRPAEAPVRVRSEQYLAIGCDLRDLQLLEKTLRNELDIVNSSILYAALGCQQTHRVGKHFRILLVVTSTLALDVLISHSALLRIGAISSSGASPPLRTYYVDAF